MSKLAARVRDLEAQVATQTNLADTLNTLNSSLNQSFARFFTDSTDAAQLLAFERHTESLLEEYSIFQPDVLYAYIEVFDAVNCDSLMRSSTAFTAKNKARIQRNLADYKEQLKKWVDGGRQM